MIGADGARSVVRQRLGVGIFTTEDLVKAHSVVFHAPLWEVVGPTATASMSPKLPHWPAFSLLGTVTRLYGFGLSLTGLPRSLRSGVRTDRAGAGVTDLHVRVVDQNTFTFSGAIADRFRSGEAFLIGDAAHR